MRSTPESSNDSGKNLAIRSWISKQLTGLAEGFGESLTVERVEIYTDGLVDISQDRLRVAFRRALYESNFFPRLAELRHLAGSNAEDEKKVEAQAAWSYVNEYLRKWGTEKLPIRSAGQWVTAPPLEPRLEYALRQIGGLWRLNQVSEQTYAFVFRDFCEAYALAPVADLMAPQLLEQFGDLKLAGNIKQLVGAREPEQRVADREPGTTGGSTEREKPRAIDELTPERKADLRRQLNEELAKRGIPRAGAGLD